MKTERGGTVMKRWRGLPFVAALCLVLAAAPKPDPLPTQGLEGGTTTKRIPFQVTNEIHQFAASQFPASFAGIAVSDGRSMVIVYRVPDQEFDAAIRRRFPDVPIVLANATMSAAVMQALSTRILNDRAYWYEQGVKITTVGPDATRSAVCIGVSRDVGSVRRQLEDHYGANRVYVVYANPVLFTLSARD